MTTDTRNMALYCDFENVALAKLTLLLAQRRRVHTHTLAREFRAGLEV